MKKMILLLCMLISGMSSAATYDSGLDSNDSSNKPQSFEEAVHRKGAVLSIPTLMGIAVNPLLSPDGGTYLGKVQVDGMEGKYIRAVSYRIEQPMVEFRGVPLNYVYILVNKKTKNFSSEGLRIGSQIFVLGTYVGNKNYSMTDGSSRMAPVLQVTYTDGIHTSLNFNN